ncbi:NAD-dependent epimerase/dehydratase family protein [Patescibacteria group bacterium]|jgi:UDP-glucose 4-epimerase|nr:NAD-dependent epimerase/dehydratase family protein [Patescibacteria group bacterium]
MARLAVVTGGAGFIGSHLVDRLIQEDWSVVVIDNLSTGSKKNVNPAAKFLKIDIRKPAAAKLIRKLKPQAVFHLAAQASVPVSVKDPIGDAETNLHATLHLLDAAADAKVKRFIFAGTGGALSSEKTRLPTDEEHASEPTSPYAIAKVASERYGAFYRLSRGLPFVSLRFANVYGPRQNPHGEAGVVAIFSKRMLKGESVKVNGTGKQTRDYIYVGDVVDAMMAAQEVQKAEGPYHVGNGVEVSVNDLFKRIAKLTGYKKKPLKGPADIGAPFRSSLDSSKIRKELDWAATTTLEEGLWLTVDWFRRGGNPTR